MNYLVIQKRWDNGWHYKTVEVDSEAAGLELSASLKRDQGDSIEVALAKVTHKATVSVVFDEP